MTVKELLEMYDNWNGVTKINDDNLEEIAKGKTLDIAEDEDLANRSVVSFGFIDNEFCIRVTGTVYTSVMKMTKDEFAQFCYRLYLKGWDDCEKEEDDGGYIRCNIADYPMDRWNRVIEGENDYE